MLCKLIESWCLLSPRSDHYRESSGVSCRWIKFGSRLWRSEHQGFGMILSRSRHKGTRVTYVFFCYFLFHEIEFEWKGRRARTKRRAVEGAKTGQGALAQRDRMRRRDREREGKGEFRLPGHLSSHEMQISRLDQKDPPWDETRVLSASRRECLFSFESRVGICTVSNVYRGKSGSSPSSPSRSVASSDCAIEFRAPAKPAHLISLYYWWSDVRKHAELYLQQPGYTR